MNRRELLKRGFELGAAGLLLPMVEPIRRYWSLDRTMVAPKTDAIYLDGMRFPISPPVTVIADYPVIGDYPGLTTEQIKAYRALYEVAMKSLEDQLLYGPNKSHPAYQYTLGG